MATLTDNDRRSLQRKLGITDNEAVFTDADLDRIYTEANGVLAAAVVVGIEELLGNAVKFSDYTSGLSSEKKSQVTDHLFSLLSHYEGKVVKANQVKILGSRVVPPRSKDAPFNNANRRSTRLSRRFGTDIEDIP